MPLGAYQYFPEVEFYFWTILGTISRSIFGTIMPLGAYQYFPEVELDFI